ncbi:hypothetical protein MCUN1_003212 [Malassezia cuniculi]|uniref:Uncharacterized protein n=1 Tax=Malassezia cuniculi TaxID=948313 RepID=A0AAF0ESP7_9BASI|nr:hypothetical protein MCUN1_003212 [Malassezia cuniculi]
MFDECLQILKRTVQWRVSSTRYNGSLPHGRRFAWRKHFVCDHAGKPRDRRDPNLEPTKRRSRRQSIKIGCPASFTATQEEGTDVVTLVCRFQHQGHTVNTREYWAKSRIPDNVREWIRDRVAEGHEQKEIVQMIHEHQKAASAMPANSPGFIPPGVTISRMDVYNIVKRFRASQTKQSPTPSPTLESDVKRPEPPHQIDSNAYSLLPPHTPLAAASPEEAVSFAQQWSEVLANLQAMQPQLMEYALTTGLVASVLERVQRIAALVQEAGRVDASEPGADISGSGGPTDMLIDQATEISTGGGAPNLALGAVADDDDEDLYLFGDAPRRSALPTSLARRIAEEATALRDIFNDARQAIAAIPGGDLSIEDQRKLLASLEAYAARQDEIRKSIP